MLLGQVLMSNRWLPTQVAAMLQAATRYTGQREIKGHKWNAILGECVSDLARHYIFCQPQAYIAAPAAAHGLLWSPARLAAAGSCEQLQNHYKPQTSKTSRRLLATPLHRTRP